MTLKKCLILKSLRNFTACGSSGGHPSQKHARNQQAREGSLKQHHAHNDVLQEDLEGHEELHLKYYK
jgi:hypothetical protein